MAITDGVAPPSPRLFEPSILPKVSELSRTKPDEIHQLKLRLSNAYLILGEKPILVDTGSPGDTEAIRSKLKALDIRFSDLAMIVHTHVHSDHMGSTAAIVQEAKCPVAYHVADQAVVDRATNGSLKGVGLRGKIMARIFSRSAFQAVNADLFLKHICDSTIMAVM